ncbi:MAG: rRNA maturation RNase YbeY [Bacteroidales bacterium]
MVSSVRFFSDGVPDIIKDKRRHKSWIKDVIHKEGKIPGEINFIFCTDIALHEMNKLYLEHDTFTDVISFNLSDPLDSGAPVEGEIYISLDRIKENSQHFGVTKAEELQRVMVHGVLHLIGYLDEKPAQRKAMKDKEDFYLSQF